MARLLYLDEAGTSGAQHESIATVAGLIVGADAPLTQLYASLEEIRSRHLPGRPNYVIHSSEIYSGIGNVFGEHRPDHDLAKRAAILSDLAALPKKLDLAVVAASVDLRELATDIGREVSPTQLGAIAHAVLYLGCILQTDSWLHAMAPTENGFAVGENANSSRRLIVEIHRQWQELKSRRVERVQEGPLIQEKRAGNPLVLADFLAFISKRVATGDADALQFQEPWIEQMQWSSAVNPETTWVTVDVNETRKVRFLASTLRSRPTTTRVHAPDASGEIES